MADYFTPPTWAFRQYDPSDDAAGLFGRLHYLDVGYSILRDQYGAYTQVVGADDDDARVSTAFYMGGRSYPISSTEKTNLQAAGYGAFITSV